MLLKDALSEGVLTREELNTNWTLLGAGEENIWVWFEKLFARHQCLGSYPELVQSYYEDAFRYYSQNNTEYLEVRVLLFGSHEATKKEMKENWEQSWDTFLEAWL